MALPDLAGRFGILSKALRQHTVSELREEICARSLPKDNLDCHAFAGGYPNGLWLSRNARALADSACAETWVPAATAALWLAWQAGARPARSVRLPVACVQPNALCWLTFYGEPNESGAIAPTPETALMFLYPDLIATVEQLHPPGWSVYWDLECPEELGAHHFRGDSLGGAAAIGLHLLTRGQAADPGFLLIARAEGGKLLPAAGEEGKFEAAVKSRHVRRLGLPAGHGLAAEQVKSYRNKMVVLEDLCCVTGAAREAGRFPFPVAGVIDPLEPRYVTDSLESLALEWVRHPHEACFSLRAPSQTGKSSLLRRMIAEAAQLGQRTAVIDAGTLAFEQNINTLYEYFLESLQRELRAEPRWRADSDNWISNFDSGMRSILTATDSPLLIAIDNTARLVDSAAGERFFQKLRSWVERTKTEHLGLRLVLMTSVDPTRLIRNIQVSPFNGEGVHQSIPWSRWDLPMTRSLNRLYGNPLDEDGLALLRMWVGGHPFLTQACLHAVADRNHPASGIVSVWRACRSVQDHLSKLSWQLEQSPALQAAFQQILQQGHAAKEDAQLLEMMGLCEAWKAEQEFGEPVDLKNPEKWDKQRRRIFVRTEPTCKLYREHFQIQS